MQNRPGKNIRRDRRREALMEWLLGRGRLSVDELAARFHVTGMTIRRDLEDLEKQGLLTRTHGGCVPHAAQVHERPFREKERQQIQQKEAIARAVVTRIPDGTSVYLDTGTTCTKVARLLRAHRRNLRVFTNNLPAAMELFDTDTVDVTVPGGVMARCSPDLVGSDGPERLLQWRFDVAVVGADALDPEAGEFYSAEDATAALSRRAQERATEVFAGIDSSKFGKRALAVAGRLRTGMVLFTDGGVPASALKHIRRTGAAAVVADNGMPAEEVPNQTKKPRRPRGGGR